MQKHGPPKFLYPENFKKSLFILMTALAIYGYTYQQIPRGHRTGLNRTRY
jgi:hypothetical protein